MELNKRAGKHVEAIELGNEPDRELIPSIQSVGCEV